VPARSNMTFQIRSLAGPVGNQNRRVRPLIGSIRETPPGELPT